jgi:hypothetical protein
MTVGNNFPYNKKFGFVIFRVLHMCSENTYYWAKLYKGRQSACKGAMVYVKGVTVLLESTRGLV